MLSAVLVIFSLTLIVLLLTRVKNLITSICVSVVWLSGTIIASGLLGGFISIEITRSWKIVISTVFSLSLVKFCSRYQAAKTFESLNLTILPMIFLISVYGLFFASTPQSFGVLLNHWDGSTNTGMVVALNQFQQINTLPKLTGVQSYPVGMHYVASWFVDLAPDSGSPTTVVNTFIAFYTALYAILLLQVGYIASLISKMLRLPRRPQVMAATLSQLTILLPFVVDGIFMVFSLAYLGAIVITLSCLIVLHEMKNDETMQTYKLGLITAGFSFLTVAASYPLLLPTIGCLSLLILFECRKYEIWLKERHTKAITFIFLLSISIGLVYLYGLIPSISPSFRFGLTGDFSTLRIDIVLLILFLPLCLIFMINRIQEKFTMVYTIFYLSITAIVGYAWIKSGSWNRGYGVNYYAKKSEFMMFLLFTPLAIVSVFSMLNSFKGLRTFVRFSQTVSISVVTLICFHAMYNGIFKQIVEPSLKNSDLNALMSTAIKAAEVPGRSVVWSSSLPALSIHASLMSNYLDRGNYLEPDYLNLNLALAQQLSVFNWDDANDSACNFIGKVESGKSQIYMLNENKIITCP